MQYNKYVQNLNSFYNRFWPRISFHQRKAAVLLYFLIIPLAITIPTPKTFALDKTIGISAGYDNNVNSTPVELGSSFTAYHLNLTHQMSHEKGFGESSVYFDSFYKNYSQFDDNFSANAGAYYSCFPGGNRVMTLGLIDAGIYRDKENYFDELNWIKIGGKLEYFYSGRITFQFMQFFNWSDYLEPVLDITESDSGSASGNTDTGLTKKRDDFYMSSDLGVTVRLHPKLNMKAYALYNRLSSNIKRERYDGFGGSIILRFSPDTLWGISAETSLWKNDFDTSEDRTDTFMYANLTINLFINQYELFIRAEFMENDSSLEYETYERIVTQCGVSIYF